MLLMRINKRISDLERKLLALVTNRPKVADKWNDNRRTRNYLAQINIDDARVWIRYRSKMTVGIKANRSSDYRNNIGCRHWYTN